MEDTNGDATPLANASPSATDASTASGDAGDESAEPSYDLSEVRRALRQLFTELQQQQAAQRQTEVPAEDEALRSAYCAVLTTLSRVGGNLLKQPANPLHLQLNLRSAAVLTKFGQYNGARALLRFMGFEEKLSAEAHSMAVPMEQLPQLRVRIERAVVILARVKQEHEPQPAGGQEHGMADVAVAADPATASPAAAASAKGGAAAMEDTPVAVVAPSSMFLANAEDEGGGSQAGSPSPPPDEEMKPDLNPSYNIAEVRAAIKTLFAEVEASFAAAATAAAPSASSSAAAPRLSPFEARMRRFEVREAFVSVADTLAKVTANVLKTPPNPAHLRINLANAAVQKKFARFAGARDYLRFLGFKETNSSPPQSASSVTEDAAAVAVAAPDTPSAAAADAAASSQWLVLSEADLVDPVKLQRALSILQQQRAEACLSSEEELQRSLGPIDRGLRVFDVNNAVVTRQPAALASPQEEPSDSRSDLALVLQASAIERKRVADLSRTDVIVTKQKVAEMKEAAKRRYHATLVKVTFSEKAAGQTQQGSGRYAQADTTPRLPGGGYKLSGIRAKYGVPSGASTTPQGDAPEEEEEEKKSSVPLPVAMPVNASAAAPGIAASAAAAASAAVAAVPAAVPVSPSLSVSVSSPPRPAAAEVLLTAYFRPWETLGDVFAWLQRDVLVHGAGTDPFYLHLPPTSKLHCGGPDPQGKNKEMSVKSLSSLGMVPAASLIFHFTPGVASAADVPGAALAAVKPDVLSCKEPFDAVAIAAMMPQAENKAELEAAKAKLMAEAKAAASAGKPAPAAAAASGSLSLGADDDDGDIEAYMRRKKAATASSLAGKAGGKPSGTASSGTSGSGSAGSAAAKRNIPGLFKPRG